MLKQIIIKTLGQNLVERLYLELTKLRIKLYGKDAIRIFHEIVCGSGKTYWLAFGSLLGAYREKGFIKNDDDIDVSMFCSDITPDLIKSMKKGGFVFDHCILTDDRQFCQLSFKYHKIPFDIYGFKKIDDNADNIIGFIPRALHAKDWEESFKLNRFKILHVTMPFGGVTTTDFAGIKACIPLSTPEFLRRHYGEDFMTPIEGKKGNSRDTITEIPIESQTASIVPLTEFFKNFN